VRSVVGAFHLSILLFCIVFLLCFGVFVDIDCLVVVANGSPVVLFSVVGIACGGVGLVRSFGVGAFRLLAPPLNFPPKKSSYSLPGSLGTGPGQYAQSLGKLRRAQEHAPEVE
jgi:hypothetical protein